MIHTITETSTPSTIKWKTDKLVQLASQHRSVLDIGCGDGHVIKQVKAEERFGIDVCAKAITKAKRHNNGVKYYCFDLMRVVEGFQALPRVDCIVGMDIVEHLWVADAKKLLGVCERACAKCLIFFIPVGHHPQTTDDRGFGNDFFQTHRSTWYPEDMESLGYEVWHYPNWHKNIKPPKEKGAMWCQKLLAKIYKEVTGIRLIVRKCYVILSVWKRL